MNTTEALYKKLLVPSDALIADIARLDGDIIILGAGGKMGPSLAHPIPVQELLQYQRIF